MHGEHGGTMMLRIQGVLSLAVQYGAACVLRFLTRGLEVLGGHYLLNFA
jgi:hypothetical protein